MQYVKIVAPDQMWHEKAETMWHGSVEASDVVCECRSTTSEMTCEGKNTRPDVACDFRSPIQDVPYEYSSTIPDVEYECRTDVLWERKCTSPDKMSRWMHHPYIEAPSEMWKLNAEAPYQMQHMRVGAPGQMQHEIVKASEQLWNLNVEASYQVWHPPDVAFRMLKNYRWECKITIPY